VIELSPAQLDRQLRSLDVAGNDYATRFVDLLLMAARQVGASDVHVQPAADRLEVRWRLDGVLQSVGAFQAGESADVVARLKVLAGLLTYRTDTPQEGRLRERMDGVEMRVSTFPTLYGERAVVRLFASAQHFLNLSDLKLPDDVEAGLRRLLGETSGALLVCGPAGSGKTTTVYACLRELVRTAGGGRSLVSLEDPIEMAVDGVAQSQMNPAAGFNLHAGLRSLMRQDPEVILVGEMRDPETAEAAFQAALTGHLLLTTFHAGSAAGAISRLSDMGIEPYLLRSGVRAIVCQRLLRRLCDCSRPLEDEAECLGLQVTSGREAVGCGDCHDTGYRGRLVLAELLEARSDDLGRAILSRSDAASLERLASDAGMVTNWRRALAAVEQGQTSPSEVRRVLGFGQESRGPQSVARSGGQESEPTS
jgi:general secretion pathway protein E